MTKCLAWALPKLASYLSACSNTRIFLERQHTYFTFLFVWGFFANWWWLSDMKLMLHLILGSFWMCELRTALCSHTQWTRAQKHKLFRTQVRNLGRTVRLSIMSSPWASRMSSCHSSVFVRQTDLHGLPNIEAPMSAKQLNPEDGRKQTDEPLGWHEPSYGPPSLPRHGASNSESVFTQSYEILYSAELQHCAPNSIDSQVLHLQEAPLKSSRAWSWLPRAFINSLV